MIVRLGRRAALFAAVLSVMLLGVLASAVPTAADPAQKPDAGLLTILEGVDFSKLDSGQLNLLHGGGFPTGKVYCTRKWHPWWCLEPLRGSVEVKRGCGPEGSNVDVRIDNPNWGRAPRNLYHLKTSTGTGFGDDSFVPPGTSIFPIRNIPPGTYDFLVRWDDQGLTFFQRLGVVLTCPSPPTPQPPGLA